TGPRVQRRRRSRHAIHSGDAHLGTVREDDPAPLHLGTADYRVGEPVPPFGRLDVLDVERPGLSVDYGLALGPGVVEAADQLAVLRFQQQLLIDRRAIEPRLDLAAVADVRDGLGAVHHDRDRGAAAVDVADIGQW